MFSKALVIGAYQKKLEEIASHSGVELIAVVPPSWRGSYEQRLEAAQAGRFRLVVSPIVLNGNFHLFFFPQLGRLLDEYRPDLVHLDEEPYNLATCLGMWECHRRGIPALFFTWQNLNRRYPIPFRAMEKYVYHSATWALAGTPAAASVLSAKGYAGRVSVIPQFGVDPELFSPRPSRASEQILRVGYAGRLVPEKGLMLLVEACARMTAEVKLTLLGEGPSRADVESTARRLGFHERISIRGVVPSAEMPEALRELDVLVLPSLSQPNWAEQFGRVLVEAMACGLAVVGSDCGEIPYVIGDAGLLFPEGDVDALAAALDRLATDSQLRAQLSARGRQRVLDRFTQAKIASDTVEVYRSVLAGASRAA